jgi:hypothetical protein
MFFPLCRRSHQDAVSSKFDRSAIHRSRSATHRRSHSRGSVLATSRCTGSVLKVGRTGCKASARRLPLTRLARKFRTPSICLPARDARRSYTMAVDPRAREITSRHQSDRRSLLPLAAQCDAVAACATRLDLPTVMRTVAALFPPVMETIRTGYWKIPPRAAINDNHCRRFHRVTPGEIWDNPCARSGPGG